MELHRNIFRQFLVNHDLCGMCKGSFEYEFFNIEDRQHIKGMDRTDYFDAFFSRVNPELWIDNAFPWDDTEEGFAYWDDLNDQWVHFYREEMKINNSKPIDDDEDTEVQLVATEDLVISGNGMDGLAAVRKLFGQGKLIIGADPARKGCDQMLAYMFDDNTAGQWEPNPADQMCVLDEATSLDVTCHRINPSKLSEMKAVLINENLFEIVTEYQVDNEYMIEFKKKGTNGDLFDVYIPIKELV